MFEFKIQVSSLHAHRDLKRKIIFFVCG